MIDPTATAEEPEGTGTTCVGCSAGQQVMENTDENGVVTSYYCAAAVCPDGYVGGRDVCGQFCV